MSSNLTNSSSQYEVILISADDLSYRFLQEWKDLEKRSMVANAFLAPELVMSQSSLRHCHQQIQILACREIRTRKLIGLGAFDKVFSSTSLPFPHLITLQESHAYRGGFLVDPQTCQEFYRELLHFLKRHRDSIFGIELANTRLNAEWCLELRKYAPVESGSFRLSPHQEVPIVDLKLLHPDGLPHYWSSSRRKSYRKNRNRLEKQGDVTFSFARTPREKERAFQTFLDLEQMSWKGELGTALQSNERDLKFAEQLLNRSLNSDFLMLSELKAGGRTAAVAMNFRSGQEVFAFKIGWDPEFKSCSPGTLHEIAMIDHLKAHCPEISRVDGCTGSDASYLASIWPHRTTLGQGMLCARKLARGTGKLIRKIRAFKSWASRLTHSIVAGNGPEHSTPANLESH
ncbi:MAG: GNAT family N-acetyltransferase [Planctomycetaceae bacterium]|nr:GNAT family N-acetyltransferase [Planctomycetaceae bacterium]